MIHFAYYIVELDQIGNIGPHTIKKISKQPKEGFKDEQTAEKHLIQYFSTNEKYLDSWVSYSIMKLYNYDKYRSPIS